jgi:hypothetical protein
MHSLRKAAIIGAIFLAGALAAAQTQPAPDPIADAIKQMGDNDYSVRQKATEFLWKNGRIAEPALKKALNDPDGEISSRAQEILEKLKYGIMPDTPPEVIDLAREYRSAAKEQKRAIAYQLVQMGRKADEVLRRIAETEDDADIHNMILDAMASTAGQRAAAAIAEGKPAAAERTLTDAMRFSYDSVRRDYAAYALYTHKLDSVIEHLQSDPHTLLYGGDMQANLKLLVFCHRAKGDLASALAAAKRADDDGLIDQILFEMCDWGTVARRLKAAPVPAGAPVDQLIASQLARLSIMQVAGNAKGVKEDLVKLINMQPPEVLLGQGLLVAGDARGALDQFKSRYQDNPLGVYDLLQEYGDYQAAAALVQQASNDGSKEYPILQFALARTHYFLGRDKEAHDLFGQLMHDQQSTTDGRIVLELIGTARQIGLDDEAFDYAAEKFKYIEATSADPQLGPGGGLSLDMLMDALFPTHYERQLYLYGVLRKDGKTPAEALKAIRSIDDRTLPENQLRPIMEKAILTVADAENGQQPDMTEISRRAGCISDSLFVLGNAPLAKPLLEKLAAQARVKEPLVRLGDLAADQLDWAAAAAYYDKAFARDDTQAAILYLKGAALVRAGKMDEGLAAEDRANFMLLAEDGDRAILAEMLIARGMAADADLQYQNIMRTGEFRSAAMREAAETLQTRYADGGKYEDGYVAAQRSVADAWTSQVSANALPEIILSEALPLYESRAQVAIAQGHWDEAQAAMQAAAALAPQDMTVELGVIPQLDKAGRKDLADQAFNRVWDVLQKQLKDYPNCAVVLNNLAWFCANTHRHPAEAVAWATKATTLRPREFEYTDTLAAAQFAAGDAKGAAATERHALLMNPEFGFFREQIRRFESEPAPAKSSNGR